jgi:hypothetical protein
MFRSVSRIWIGLLFVLALIPSPAHAVNLFFQGRYYCNLTGAYAASPKAIHVASIMLLTAGTGASFSSGQIMGGRRFTDGEIVTSNDNYFNTLAHGAWSINRSTWSPTDPEVTGTLSLRWRGDTFTHPAPETCDIKASAVYEGRVGAFSLDCESPKFSFAGACAPKALAEKRGRLPSD